jgi:diadenosine tetraphosphatase ApaH/serine/threonine PP2A family protein phosphatase
MILAVLSDVHANLEALEACLLHARESGAGRYAFLGDLVGYGADPQAVVDIVARYAAGGAVVVKGNHDEAIASSAAYMNDMALEAIEWTRGALSTEAKAFLAGLPLCVREESMCFVHASAAFPERWEYVDSPSAAGRSIAAANAGHTFSGHVHAQELYFQRTLGKASLFRPVAGSSVPVGRNHQWLALVGSVGQPRDRNPAAAYALFDAARERVTFHRIPYDNHAAANKIRSAGLPAAIAYRVEVGV